VTFNVIQTWKEGKADAIGVIYEDIDNRMTCFESENVDDTTSELTAKCVEGVTEIAIVVRDSTFSGLSDISDCVPSACKLFDDDTDSQAMFFFTVPCMTMDASFCKEQTLCPENEESASPTSLEAPTTSPTVSPMETRSGVPSESPIVASTKPPTESVTENPTETPTATPTATPTMVPTWADDEEPICVQLARLESDSSSGAYDVSIDITSQVGSTVTFSIDQNWKDSGTVDWIAVAFETIDTMMTCEVSDAVGERTSEYVAKCVDGTADVTVFVRDSTFGGLPDVTETIPMLCDPEISEENKEKHVSSVFTAPCTVMDDSFCKEHTRCPETGSVSVAPTEPPQSVYPSLSPTDVSAQPIVESSSSSPSTVPSSQASVTPNVLESDSTPTSLPTSGPTSAPTSSPTLTPTCMPTWNQKTEPICVQQARLDQDSLGESESGNYDGNPIVITSQVGSTVRFKVDQTWNSDSIDWLAVVYETIDQDMDCERTADVTGETSELVALCVDGVAEVTIFVRDNTFSDLPDITSAIPSMCEALSDGTANSAMFTFSVPCDEMDESFCDEQTDCPEDEPTTVPVTAIPDNNANINTHRCAYVDRRRFHLRSASAARRRLRR